MRSRWPETVSGRSLLYERRPYRPTSRAGSDNIAEGAKDLASPKRVIISGLRAVEHGVRRPFYFHEPLGLPLTNKGICRAHEMRLAIICHAVGAELHSLTIAREQPTILPIGPLLAVLVEMRLSFGADAVRLRAYLRRPFRRHGGRYSTPSTRGCEARTYGRCRRAVPCQVPAPLCRSRTSRI